MKFHKSYVPLSLAFLSLTLGIFHVWKSWEVWKEMRNTQDPTSSMEERISPVLDNLPQNVMMVGYVDASSVPGSETEFDQEEFDFLQYSMAPILLQEGLEHPWIIGNFGDEDVLFEPWLDETLGEYEIQHFGYGIYLIHDR
jgi:hypothetical protein